MKADQINSGELIRHAGKIYSVTEKEMRGHGKVAPTVHMKLREVETGNFSEHTFRPGDTIEKIAAEKVDMEYSYIEDNFYVFMNTDTYEQVRFNKNSLGKKGAFLQEGSKIRVLMVEGQAMSIEFPETMTLKVTTSMDGLKNVDKEVELENGMKALVSHFVSEGDKIVVRTEDGSYVERVTTKSLSSGEKF